MLIEVFWKWLHRSQGGDVRVVVDIIGYYINGIMDRDVGKKGFDVQGREGVGGLDGTDNLQKIISWFNDIFTWEVGGDHGIKLFSYIISRGRYLGDDWS